MHCNSLPVSIPSFFNIYNVVPRSVYRQISKKMRKKHNLVTIALSFIFFILKDGFRVKVFDLKTYWIYKKQIYRPLLDTNIPSESKHNHLIALA